jgi:hypothetical protein
MPEPLLKRTKRTVTTPGEAEEILQQRMQALGMTFQQYVASLIAYDCWAEKPHALTGQACTAGRADEQLLWQEVIRDFGKPNKTGGFFEHRLEELLRERLAQNQAGEPPDSPDR